MKRQRDVGCGQPAEGRAGDLEGGVGCGGDDGHGQQGDAGGREALEAGEAGKAGQAGRIGGLLEVGEAVATTGRGTGGGAGGAAARFESGHLLFHEADDGETKLRLAE